MNSTDLRNKILKYVNAADDNLLHHLEDVILEYGNTKKVELPEVVKQLLEQSQEDIKEGRVLEHSEVMRTVKEKFNIKN